MLTHATWPQVIAALTFPIMAGKQIINVVQFWKASKIVCPLIYFLTSVSRSERGSMLTGFSSLVWISQRDKLLEKQLSRLDDKSWAVNMVIRRDSPG